MRKVQIIEKATGKVLDVDLIDVQGWLESGAGEMASRAKPEKAEEPKAEPKVKAVPKTTRAKQTED